MYRCISRLEKVDLVPFWGNISLFLDWNPATCLSEVSIDSWEYRMILDLSWKSTARTAGYQSWKEGNCLPTIITGKCPKMCPLPIEPRPFWVDKFTYLNSGKIMGKNHPPVTMPLGILSRENVQEFIRYINVDQPTNQPTNGNPFSKLAF